MTQLSKCQLMLVRMMFNANTGWKRRKARKILVRHYKEYGYC